jgi:hypothetical protein
MGSGVFRAFRLARYVLSVSAVPAARFSEAFGVTDHTVPTGRPIDAGGSDGRSGLGRLPMPKAHRNAGAGAFLWKSRGLGRANQVSTDGSGAPRCRSIRASRLNRPDPNTATTNARTPSAMFN